MVTAEIKPGWGSPELRLLSQYADVADLIPSQGTYKNQPITTNEYINKWNNKSMFLSLSFSPHLPLSQINL